jgi:hypothetical protein
MPCCLNVKEDQISSTKSPVLDRPLGLSLMHILVTIMVGASIRFAKLGLPFYVVKYAGSMLWALSIYWIMTAARPSSRRAGCRRLCQALTHPNNRCICIGSAALHRSKWGILMTPEEALEIWAPQGSPWSPWTKPVLFSFLPGQLPETPFIALEPKRIVPLLEETALLVELPGRRSLDAGLSLAMHGYRPIPLYNATPSAFPGTESSSMKAPALIDLSSIVEALEQGTSALKEMALPLSAPPAFLLDAARHDASFSPDSTWFDNRSIVRTSDVPSGEFLTKHGISQVVLIQTSEKIREDLRFVLVNWQRAGLPIFWQSWAGPWEPRALHIDEPNFLQVLWTRLRLRLQFSPNSSGAFGRFSGGSG